MAGTAICLLSALIGLHTAAAAAQSLPTTGADMELRVRACTGCHGDEGRAGPDGFYPRLAGKPAAYLHEQLLNFRDGRRQYGLMSRLLAPLTDEYLLEFAQHFAARQLAYPPPPRVPADAEALRLGQQLVLRGDPERGLPGCVSCHGRALAGVLPDVPGLLGLPKDYLSAQLGAWQAGTRRARAPDCMAEVARRLRPQDVEAVSSWLAAQAVPGRYVAAPSLAAAGAQLPPADACGARALRGRGEAR